jgi:hypothetical protein
VGELVRRHEEIGDLRSVAEALLKEGSSVAAVEAHRRYGDLAQAAVAAMQSGEAEAGARICEEGGALFEAALLWRQAGHADRALELFGRVSTTHPKYLQAAAFYGREMRKRGDAGRAADKYLELSTGMRVSELSVAMFYDMGLLLEEQGRHGEATAAFEAIVAFKADHLDSETRLRSNKVKAERLGQVVPSARYPKGAAALTNDEDASIAALFDNGEGEDGLLDGLEPDPIVSTLVSIVSTETASAEDVAQGGHLVGVAAAASLESPSGQALKPQSGAARGGRDEPAGSIESTLVSGLAVDPDELVATSVVAAVPDPADAPSVAHAGHGGAASAHDMLGPDPELARTATFGRVEPAGENPGPPHGGPTVASEPAAPRPAPPTAAPTASVAHLTPFQGLSPTEQAALCRVLVNVRTAPGQTLLEGDGRSPGALIVSEGTVEVGTGSGPGSLRAPGWIVGAGPAFLGQGAPCWARVREAGSVLALRAQDKGRLDGVLLRKLQTIFAAASADLN